MEFDMKLTVVECRARNVLVRWHQGIPVQFENGPKSQNKIHRKHDLMNMNSNLAQKHAGTKNIESAKADARVSDALWLAALCKPPAAARGSVNTHQFIDRHCRYSKEG